MRVAALLVSGIPNVSYPQLTFVSSEWSVREVVFDPHVVNGKSIWLVQFS